MATSISLKSLGVMRPWDTEFFRKEHFSKPETAEIKKRLDDNLTYFSMNYAILSLIILVIFLILHPIAALVLLVVGGILYASTYLGEVIEIADKKLPKRTIQIGLVVVMAVVTLSLCGVVLFAILGSSMLLIGTHSILYNNNCIQQEFLGEGKDDLYYRV